MLKGLTGQKQVLNNWFIGSGNLFAFGNHIQDQPPRAFAKLYDLLTQCGCAILHGVVTMSTIRDAECFS